MIDPDAQGWPSGSRHPFRGRARWAVATILVIGPLLQAVEFLIVPAPSADPNARLAMWSENQAAVGVSIAAGTLAIPFLMGGFATMAALSMRDSRRFAWVAIALLTLAMIGLAAIHGVLIAGYALLLTGDEAAAVAVLEDAYVNLPGIIVIVTFLIGAVLGIVTLVVASWRSRWVPRVVPVLLLVFFILDFALGQPVVAHVVSLAAFSMVAWAVATRYQRSLGGVARGSHQASEEPPL